MSVMLRIICSVFRCTVVRFQAKAHEMWLLTKNKPYTTKIRQALDSGSDLLLALLKDAPVCGAASSDVIGGALSKICDVYKKIISCKSYDEDTETKLVSICGKLLSRIDHKILYVQINCYSLTCSMLFEVQNRPKKLQITRLAMQHGMPFPALMCSSWYNQNRSRSVQDLSLPEFMTDDFLRLVILTSLDRQRLRRAIQKEYDIGMFRESGRFPNHTVTEAMMRFLCMLSEPLSLQDACVICVRRCLRGGLWRQIDTLPVPSLLKDLLKLVKY